MQNAVDDARKLKHLSCLHIKMLDTKAIIAKNTYNGTVPFYIKSILPYIKQLTFEPKHGWFVCMSMVYSQEEYKC